MDIFAFGLVSYYFITNGHRVFDENHKFIIGDIIQDSDKARHSIKLEILSLDALNGIEIEKLKYIFR